MFLNSVRFTVKCLKCANPTRTVQVKVIPDLKKYSNYARHPSKILNQEEILDHVESANGPKQFLDDGDDDDSQKPLKIRSKKSKPKKKLSVTPNDTRLKEDGKLNYLELKENDTRLT